MDRIKAEILEKALVGNSIQGWTIRSLISNGKSAAVFLADGKEGMAAVKVFDTELIARYGDETQFARIDRERELIGKSHPKAICFPLSEDEVMVSAVGNSPSVLAPQQAQSQSGSGSSGVSFQQAVDQYTQDTTSGAGGNYGSGTTNASQTLSSDLMSSLLQMQS
jgi:hypothetical protein